MLYNKYFLRHTQRLRTLEIQTKTHIHVTNLCLHEKLLNKYSAVAIKRICSNSKARKKNPKNIAWEMLSKIK